MDVLRAALRWRWVVLVLARASIALLGVLGGSLCFEFIPIEDRSEFMVQVRAPLGASVDATSRILDRAAFLAEVVPPSPPLPLLRALL